MLICRLAVSPAVLSWVPIYCLEETAMDDMFIVTVFVVFDQRKAYPYSINMAAACLYNAVTGLSG